MSITRRDFLNGTALTIAAAATLSPRDLLAQAAESYPPALTGLRGSTDAAFQIMHGRAREGAAYSIDGMKDEESYDLVVVGAGLAGLSAAWFQKQRTPHAKILILDNHDDFGGHARRNEFTADGRLLLSYGGSETMVSPRTQYAKPARRMFRGLGLDPERFYDEAVFHRALYPGLGLSRGVFFAGENFGRDALVTGDPLVLGFDEFAPAAPNSRPFAQFIADCPLSDAAKAGIIALQAGTRDSMAGTPIDDKVALLRKTSYRDFIEKTCALPKDAADFFQGRLNDNFGLGIDAIAAFDAMEGGLPGAKGLAIADKFESHGEEPYVHHFPDGNASIARLIVRALIPGVAPGRGMDDIVTARFDYAKLDVPGSPVRIRLTATAVIVRNEGAGVAIGYVAGGTLRRVRARRAIVATYGMVMPHIVEGISPSARETLAQNVKAPLLYSKALVRNWECFAKLGVHSISAPMNFLTTVKLDYPVSLGRYKFPRQPSEPMVVHMVHVPLKPNEGLSARDQYRAGRHWLLDTPFPDIERLIRADLQRMLGAGGFEHERDIAAITVNRWSHGYSHYWNSLYDDVAAGEAATETAKTRIGNIALANTDTAWDAYAHAAIAEAARAVAELA